MRGSVLLAAFLSIFSVSDADDSNLTDQLSSHQILPKTFKPEEVWRNVNLLRNINLERGYVRETINVVIENTHTKPQDNYYFPFQANTVSKVGGFEVRDKKDASKPPFPAELVEYDPYRWAPFLHLAPLPNLLNPYFTSSTQFYRITFPASVQPSQQLTLSITYHILSTLQPLPALIEQNDKQYLRHTFSTFAPSSYPTSKQKTKLKFPNAEIPEYTSDPERQGSTFTYGPYDNIPAGAEQEASVRYEFTKPLIHATLLERDVEVSQWGGNLATEERYWLTNRGANLKNQFSRVAWAASQYYNPPTSAIKELKVPLKIGSLNPYFTDDIGNVSTSRFRSNVKEANLELKPRYPVFGGWKYSFRIGWDANLKDSLRKLKTGDGYVLKVPFLEGPKMAEGVSYEKVQVRVILPEGATNVKFETAVPLVKDEILSHKTFMDTLGRTMLKLTAMNVVDASREQDLIVSLDSLYLALHYCPCRFFRLSLYLRASLGWKARSSIRSTILYQNPS